MERRSVSVSSFIPVKKLSKNEQNYDSHIAYILLTGPYPVLIGHNQ